jgi:photosystem II stability/assembly factor-like uncharacterized protein
MNKKHVLMSAVLIASGLSTYFLTNHSSKKEQKSEKEALEQPAEHFAFMRSYPDVALDYRAYSKMLTTNASLLQLEANAQAKSMSGNWQLEGPLNIGGRVTAFAIHPTNNNIMFAGCPGGGLFKTTNGGGNWTPVFDNQAALSIACITFDPFNSNTIYVGTGDPDTPFTAFVGNGIYKSTDGGTTWTNIGLSQMGIISKVVVNPTNGNVLYAAAMGVPMQRNNQRGVYKSTNGGVSWSQVLFIDNQTGVSDLIVHPTNGNIVYATSWSRIRTNQESLGYSTTSRVYTTGNGGSTWTILNNGLPGGKLSRYGICMSKQNPSKLYVAVCDSTYQLEGVYVTTNGGQSFTNLPNAAATATNIYGGFGWYFGKIYVNPSNDNDVFLLGVEHYRSQDGGQTWFMNQPPWWQYNPHADCHGLQFKGPGNYVLATDGGLYETNDDGANWNKIDDLPNTQFYRVHVNPHQSADYWGGAQDNGTMNGNNTNMSNWPRVFGGDGFQPRIDASNSNNVYVETQNGNLNVSTDGGFTFNSFDNTLPTSDRRNWDMPYVFGANSNIMYTGTYRVFKNTSNPFDNWTPISNDLTDGIIYGSRFHTISALDHSKLNTQHIYAGTSDGNVWRSLNDGNTWDSLHMTLPNRYVTSIHPSPNVANNVYVTHSGYRYNSYIPHIHKSTNNGTTWINISGDLPQTGINDVLIKPGSENTLFVATDIGVYYTTNGGTNWLRLGTNMPLIPIWDIEYDAANTKLIAGTYARSIQSIDVSNLALTTGLQTSISSTSSVLEVFPNPANTSISLKTSVSKIDQLQIIDASGKTVLNPETNLTNSIDISSLASGLYFVKIVANDKTELKRFVKL